MQIQTNTVAQHASMLPKIRWKMIIYKIEHSNEHQWNVETVAAQYWEIGDFCIAAEILIGIFVPQSGHVYSFQLPNKYIFIEL